MSGKDEVDDEGANDVVDDVAGDLTNDKPSPDQPYTDKDRAKMACHIDRKRAMMESDEMFHKNIHQELKPFTQDQLKEYSLNMNLGYDVMILSICGDLNVGTIMRTSHLFGVRKFVVYGKKSFDSRSTVGALKYTDIERVYGIKDADHTEKKILTTTDRIVCPETLHRYLTKNDLVPVLVEQHENAVFLEEIDWKYHEEPLNKRSFCFIFGNEGDGITSDVIDRCLQIEGSFVLSIRQMGVLRSLNVSAAAAIVIHSYYAHRMKSRTDYLTCFSSCLSECPSDSKDKK